MKCIAAALALVIASIAPAHANRSANTYFGCVVSKTAINLRNGTAAVPAMKNANQVCDKFYPKHLSVKAQIKLGEDIDTAQSKLTGIVGEWEEETPPK